MKVKVDRVKVSKKTSRNMFSDSDMRTRVVPVKKLYNRKTKHKNMMFAGY